MALLTASELLLRYDGRRVGDAVLDDDTRASDADWTNGSSTAGQRVLAAIADAEGELISAITVGDRYTLPQIATLMADQPTSYSANLIRRIVADLTYGNLLLRRANAADELNALAPGWAKAQQMLTLLRQAERIFPDIPGVPEAGLPGEATSIPTYNQPPLLSQIAIPLYGYVNQAPYGWSGNTPYWPNRGGC